MADTPELPGSSRAARALQPLLHDVVLCVAAPAFAASPRDGQLRGARADGFYDHDRRLLHTLCLLLDGRAPEPVGVQPLGPDRVRFTSVHRCPGDGTADPTLIVERVRTAGDGETVLLRNVGTAARRLRVELTAATDLADIADVKRGLTGPAVAPSAPRAGGPALVWRSPTGRARVRAVECPEEPETATGPAHGTFTWPRVELAPGGCWLLRLAVTGRAVPDPPGHPVAAPPRVPWSDPVVRGDRRLIGLVRQGLAELRALRLADRAGGGSARCDDQFIAAGCPWYLTLFGRDSLWSARMLLPLGTELARGTLWTLARRQGTVHDDFREEAPGRILHELRPAESRHGQGLLLPAHYYGSVDATPLFVSLLVDAWRWGLPAAEVEGLLPYAERAMAWIVRTSGKDKDGLLRYYPRRGGLLHQSWKDSADAVRDAAGRRVEPPLALCEVQGYAYEAATGLADLLHSRGATARARRLRTWAVALRGRFADAFWIDAKEGPAPRYVAIAVGRDLAPVTGPASNMGQLLGTGILDRDGCADVAAWLAAPELNSGWGLRSRSAAVPGFNPLSYHGGSVWTHDTAIAVQGLCAAGRPAEAALLADGLLDAAVHFSYRMPELYGGDARTETSPAPLAYPAACRPQGWSAASGVAVLGALLGLRPDAPRRELRLRPLPAGLLGPLAVSGLRLAGADLSVRIDHAGRTTVTGLPDGWRVDTGGGAGSDTGAGAGPGPHC
ncbi:glycogen debranching N-terminal domain-containing protein [Streptomyces kanamyceticus]|uniref:Glycogen debranching protein n=1 Tax=Streptomyces kanamyceticus TaxID=1967 RepID=A0A5J6GMU5_STRKN|nr:glycogen debranching N-terminal domain-containing protein [Streptomyces kanamyceticus]QEU95138.1 glycogen debranching protein [Streptomyces kanamyceticus]